MKRWPILFLLISFIISFLYAQDIPESVSPGTITFSFKDADIRNVLRLISAKSGVNIVYGPEVTGVVNMELKDVPWEQALGLVLDINGFSYQKAGNVIKVLKKEDVSKEPLTTEVFRLNYSNAKDIVESLNQMLTERGSIKTDIRSNTLIVTDIPAIINKIETVLLKIDTRTSQVLIETKIVEMNNTKEKDLGIKWTSLKEYKIALRDPRREYESERTSGHDREDEYTRDTDETYTDEYIYSVGSGTASETISDTLTDTIGYTLTDTFTKALLKSDIRSAILSADDFEIILSALQAQTDLNLISNPRVLTANNEKAQIKVVQQYPIPNYTFDTSTSTFTISGFTYKDIGVIFEVTPNISTDGYITMRVEPHVSKYIRDIPFSASGATVYIPLVAVKKANAKLIMKDGDTIAIGGLIDEENRNTVTKVPLLGDIPVLGRLFRHDGIKSDKKDIIFFITATIIDEKTAEFLREKPGSIAQVPVEDVNKVIAPPPAVPVQDEEIKGGNKGYTQRKPRT